MKIMLLAAATLSLGVGAADADNKGNANTNEGNANTRYMQTIREAAPASHPGGSPAARCSCCSAAEGLAAGPTVDPALLTRSAGRASGRGVVGQGPYGNAQTHTKQGDMLAGSEVSRPPIPI